jgi:predicted small secreted protein
METKTKWMIGIGIAITIALLLWMLFHKDQDLKDALTNLKTATEQIKNANAKIDSSILINQNILRKNQGFQNYIHAVDSITLRRDTEARRRESAFISRLENVNKTIERLKTELMKSSDHLPLPPMDSLQLNP